MGVVEENRCGGADLVGGVVEEEGDEENPCDCREESRDEKDHPVLHAEGSLLGESFDPEVGADDHQERGQDRDSLQAHC